MVVAVAANPKTTDPTMRNFTNILANLNAFLRGHKGERKGWAKQQQLDNLHKVMGYRKDTPEY